MTIKVYCRAGTVYFFRDVDNIIRIRKDYISIKYGDGSVGGCYFKDDGGIVSIVFEEEE